MVTPDCGCSLSRPPAFHTSGTTYFRASAVSQCLKALIASRMGIEGDDPPEDMQRRFDDGHLHEPAILQAVTDQTGWKMKGQSQQHVEVDAGEVDDTRLLIVAHLDEIAGNQAFSPDRRVVEVKALSQSGFESWTSKGFDDFPYYAAQLTVQMEATGLPAIFAVKNKNSGKVDVTLVDDPPTDLAPLVDRLKLVEILGGDGRLPGPCDKRMYPCPWWRLHEDDDGNEVAGLAEHTQQERDDFAALCAEYAAAREMEKEGKQRKKEAGRKLMEQYLEWEDTVQEAGWRVTKTPHTYRWLNEDRMRADGIDPDVYREERYSTYPKVTRKDDG